MVLQLADRLGNASEACRRAGVDRTSFYQWKRRFARDGVEGLGNRSPVHKSHPHTTPADVERRIVSLGLQHPAHGCDRIEKALARHGIDVSAVTIQKILHKAGLGTSKTRGLALETRYRDGHRRLSAEQVSFLDAFNPCFRERNNESSRPGERLCHGTFFLGRFGGPGPLYVHAVVDSFSSYAFGVLAVTPAVEDTIAVLRQRALPFFAARNIAPELLATGKLSDVGAKSLSQVLSSSGITRIACDDDRGNGFVERFRRTTVEEFLRQPFVRRNLRAGVARLQREFDEWLKYYNYERPHPGYRNYGKVPYALVAGG